MEVKETKRWADVEDSDEEQNGYESVHAREAAARHQQCCADDVLTDSLRASQAAEQVMKGFYWAFANAMLPDQEAQALVVVQHSER